MNKNKPSFLRRYIRSYNFLGIITGSLFMYLSFMPSLLPRGWILQGILSAITFTIGYGIGVFISLIIREFKPKEPRTHTKTVAKMVTVIVLDSITILFLLLGWNWQNDVRKLVGQPTEPVGTVLGTLLVLLVMVIFIMFIVRLILKLAHWLKRVTMRILPPRLAYVLAVVVTAIIVVGLLNGVIFEYARNSINTAFSVKNDATEEGVTQPTVPELTGNPDSLISWDSLGRQGRRFVSNGQNTEQLGKFNGTPAAQPVRVYAGLESTDTTEERANLAVRELKRAGGFDRQVLLVVTTTGTGWVDEEGVEGLEYMYNGDTAMVAMQYSYLPSWLSFLVDRSKAQEAGIELYNAILAEWQKLPLENRPKLVVFGESLGSFGSESAFTGLSAFKATSQGAVWAGPPNFNHLWRKSTTNRDEGTPEILPVVNKGSTVRYATKAEDFNIVPTDNWQTPRAAYLQNPSDPIVWWSPNLLFHKPDWLKEPRGADVSHATRWTPIVTFWLVTGDMVFATGVPDNHGHKYGTMPTAAWSQVAPPDGWTAEKTEALRNFLAENKRGND